MDCIGLEKIYGDDYSEQRCSAAGYESSPLYDEWEYKIEEDMIFGEHPYCDGIPQGLDNIFKLLNLLFPKTYLYCEHNSGSSVSYEFLLEEHLYNPETLTLIISSSGTEDYFGDEDESCEEGSYYEWEDSDTQNIQSLIPDKEFIRSIIEKSTEKGYTELTALLLDKCKDIV